MKKTSFSETVYVVWEKQEYNKPYMMVYLHPADAAEIHREVEVGIYKLKRVAKVKTTAEVV